jgi:hypothetical protein
MSVPAPGGAPKRGPYPRRSCGELASAQVLGGSRRVERTHLFRFKLDRQRPPLFTEALRAAKKALDPRGLRTTGDDGVPPRGDG